LKVYLFFIVFGYNDRVALTYILFQNDAKMLSGAKKNFNQRKFLRIFCTHIDLFEGEKGKFQKVGDSGVAILAANNLFILEDTASISALFLGSRDLTISIMSSIVTRRFRNLWFFFKQKFINLQVLIPENQPKKPNVFSNFWVPIPGIFFIPGYLYPGIQKSLGNNIRKFLNRQWWNPPLK